MSSLTTEYPTHPGEPVPGPGNDGLKKQLILLEEISRELDNYFSRPLLGKECFPEQGSN